jgi:hypothetical protein
VTANIYKNGGGVGLKNINRYYEFIQGLGLELELELVKSNTILVSQCKSSSSQPNRVLAPPVFQIPKSSGASTLFRVSLPGAVLCFNYLYIKTPKVRSDTSHQSQNQVFFVFVFVSPFLLTQLISS